MGCFSHARRVYVDALKALPKEAEKSRALSSAGIAYIDRLFELEREYEGMTPGERHAARTGCFPKRRTARRRVRQSTASSKPQK
ncbi:MAG: hypothetical protein LBS67_05775 [Clostridiales Family XIII bacterium]|jgi:hypothetical protein|nr:hypothetical protein [Clostridiales Family XIII bacterium]